jgi:transposase
MRAPSRYVSVLKYKEIAELRRLMKESPSARVRQRAQGIILSHQQYNINQIAEIFAVKRDTVTGWINAWEDSGFDGLADKPKPGRPTILNSKEQELALSLAEKEPRSIKKVISQIAEKTKKDLSPWTLKRLLKKRANLEKSEKISKVKA